MPLVMLPCMRHIYSLLYSCVCLFKDHIVDDDFWRPLSHSQYRNYMGDFYIVLLFLYYILNTCWTSSAAQIPYVVRIHVVIHR